MPTRLVFDMDLSDENLTSVVGMKCLLALREGPEFSILEELDDDDWRAFQVALNFLAGLRIARGLLDAAVDNYNELADALNNYHASGESCCDEHVRGQFDHLINRRLSNFLSSMRLFLDHLEYRMKITYGKTSDEVKVFKDSLGSLFDTVLAYRFSYKLRNYCQHFGLPVVVGHDSSVDDTDGEVRYVPKTQFHTDYLLQVGGDCWGPVRTDLRSMPDFVDVASVLRDLPDALFKAWEAYLDAQKSNIAMMREAADKRFGERKDDPGVVVVGEWLVEDGEMVLSYQVPALDALFRAERDLAAAG